MIPDPWNPLLSPTIPSVFVTKSSGEQMRKIAALSSHPESDPMTCGQCKFSAYHGPVLVTHAMSTHEKRKCKSCDYEVGTTPFPKDCFINGTISL